MLACRFAWHCRNKGKLSHCIHSGGVDCAAWREFTNLELDYNRSITESRYFKTPSYLTKEAF